MTNYTSYPGDDRTISQSGGQNAAGFPCVDVMQGEFDSSKLNLATATTDTVELADIPAGATVINATVEVLTAEASTVIDIGTTADPDGFVDGADGGTAGLDGGTAGALINVLQTSATKLVAAVPATTADWTTLKFRVALTVSYAD